MTQDDKEAVNIGKIVDKTYAKVMRCFESLSFSFYSFVRDKQFLKYEKETRMYFRCRHLSQWVVLEIVVQARLYRNNNF